MIYVSRTGKSGRIRPPRVVREPAAGRRLGLAFVVVALVASVLGGVLVLNA